MQSLHAHWMTAVQLATMQGPGWEEKAGSLMAEQPGACGHCSHWEPAGLPGTQQEGRRLLSEIHQHGAKWPS